MTSKNSGPQNEMQLTFSAEDSPAKTSALLESVRDWQESEAASGGNFIGSLEYWNLHGFLSRTYLDYYQATLAKTFLQSSTAWMSWGTAWRGAYLTLSISESPNDAVECSLSDVLESHVRPKYSLSPKAAQGILRRAEARGKTLPEQFVAGSRYDGESETSVVAFNAGQSARARSMAISENLSPTLFSKGQPPTIAQPIQEWQQNGGAMSALVHDGGGAKTGLYMQDGGVRRLTPLECERLQGFPDGWTEGLSDAQRYKALGNAVTVPVIEWIGKRIIAQNAT